MTPHATYRLQFSKSFGFAEAAGLAPYLAALGISHVYSAPIFTARPGSSHGYDMIDPTEINPELGGEPGFRAMAAALRAEGLGLIVDFVPNHMGVGPGNRYWQSVLEEGPASPYAHWFDIDWQSPYPGLAGKLLAPVLGDSYGAALAAGDLELRFDTGSGSLAVWAYGTHRLPIRPQDYAGILGASIELEPLAAELAAAAGDSALFARARQRLALEGGPRIAAILALYRGLPGKPESWAPLDALIALQHWRAAQFELDCEAINYRRFFTISELAGLRVEDQSVFDETHRALLGLLAEGLIDGIRIDHIDGLVDPKAYCLRLREAAGQPFFLVVEKILAPDETLPADWQADGTTGYEFANLAIGLLVDPSGEAALSRLYADFTGQTAAPADIVEAAKHEIMAHRMAAELDALATRLHQLAQADPTTRDLGRLSLRGALAEYVVALDVYRSYADADGLPAADHPRVAQALAAARAQAPALAPATFDFLARVLTFERAGDDTLDTLRRIQQFSGPVMAKGLEDTALYRFNRLIALNEVGSKPGLPGLDVAAFHRANQARRAAEPRSMLTTTTHDTKRGEDARARIAALSGHAAAWADAVRDWTALLDPAIDANIEYFFYQTLIGAWPVAWRPETAIAADDLASLAERLTAAMLKSAREAAVQTRWVHGDPDYEAAVAAFVARALDPAGAFLSSFRRFEARIALDGMRNGLIQTSLRLTLPGIPDLYQGAELWEQSLVDPDNRRPVDFAARTSLLDSIGGSAVTAADWHDGSVKLALTARLLQLRRENPALFADGDYQPLDVAGPGADRLVAFVRRERDCQLLVMALLQSPAPRLADLSVAAPAGPWRDLLGGGIRTAATPADLLCHFPVAVLLQA